MTTASAPDHLLEAASGAAPEPGRAPAVSRRGLLGWIMLALLPASVLVALAVLYQMAANAAAATGGCGGG